MWIPYVVGALCAGTLSMSVMAHLPSMALNHLKHTSQRHLHLKHVMLKNVTYRLIDVLLANVQSKGDLVIDVPAESQVHNQLVRKLIIGRSC